MSTEAMAKYTVLLIDGDLDEDFAPSLSFHNVSAEDFESLRRLAEAEDYLVVSRREAMQRNERRDKA